MIGVMPECVEQVVELDVLVTTSSGKFFRPKLLVKFDAFSRTVVSMAPVNFQFSDDLAQHDGSCDIWELQR